MQRSKKHTVRALFAVAGLLMVAFVFLIKNQQSIAQWVSAQREQQVTAALSSVTLNNGTTHVTFGSDITSQADLAPDNGAYRWTAAGANYTALNMPFNSGTQTDFSGNGYTATNAGNTTYTSTGCLVGGCLVFDGVDDYSALNSTAPVLNLTSLTISLWANLSTGGDLIGNHNAGSTWESFILSTGSFALNSANNSTTNRKVLAYTFPVDSTWHHVAAVWNGSNMFVYVDGVQVAGPLAFTGTPWANTFPAYIGAERSASTPPAVAEVAGRIDELQLYRRALSADQIAQLYADGLAAVGGPTTIKSAETYAGQFWNLTVTPITTAGAAGSAQLSGNPAVITAGPSAIVGSLNDANESTELVSSLTVPAGSISGMQWLVNSVPIMKLNYPFNSGTQIDASGNNSNGTLNGPVFTTTDCKVGGCLSFDGVNDYVVSSGVSDLTGNPSFSVETWFYVPSNATVTGTYPTFVWWGTASSADAAHFGTYSTTRNQLFLGFNNGGQRMTGTFSNDRWHHAVWTRTGGGNAGTGNVLYVDGASVPLTNDLSPTITPTVTASAYELQRGGAGADYITAKLDEVKVYNRVLTADEVYRSYLDGLGSGPTSNDGVGSPTRIVTAGHALNDTWSLVAQEFLSDGSTGYHLSLGSDTIQAAAATVLNVTTPSTQQAENIVISYTCTNADNQVRDILVQFSTNGGSSYANATVVGASSGLVSINTVIGSTCDGSTQTVTWDSLINQVGINNIVDTDVRVKLVVNMTGTPTAETTNFSVMNPFFFATNTSIGSAVTTYDGEDITCSGPMTLTIDGTHTFDGIRVLNGCTLTHTANSGTPLTLTVTGNVTIDASSIVNLDAKGYLGALTPSNTSHNGGGPGGGIGASCFGCASSGGGASHGGKGANATSGNVGASGAINGAFDNPTTMGSGGGGCSSGSSQPDAGHGGGFISLTVGGNFTLNGSITANGQAGQSCSGGGSGGGIKIIANSMTGSGAVSANGAASGSTGGGSGGGGRIALITTTGTVPNYAMTAYSPVFTAGQAGGAGTIYVKNNTQSADLIVDNEDVVPQAAVSDNSTVVSGAQTLGSVMVRDKAVLGINASWDVDTVTVDDGTLVALTTANHVMDTVTVSNGGNITAGTRVSATDYAVDIDAVTMSIDVTSTMNLNGKGYRGGRTSTIPTTYNGEGAGGTTGGDCFGCSYGIGGAGHGGKGANGSGGTNNSTGGAAYGSVTYPITMGSGAAGSTSGSASSSGGHGGGLLILNVAGTFTNNGVISANGTIGTVKGGGAGGGINITAGTFVGAGSFTANGGASGDAISGAGAGGRIALIATTAVVPGTFTYEAFSGSGLGHESGSGTVYVKDPGVDGDLIVDNNNIVIQTTIAEDATPLIGSNAFRTVTVRNQAYLVLVDTQTMATLSVQSAGTVVGKSDVTHAITSTTVASGGNITVRTRDGSDYSLRISGTSFTVDNGGTVNLNGKGFRGGAANGAAIGNGEGPGGGGYASCFGCNRSGGGGGFGGQGGTGSSGVSGAGGAAYGSYSNPLHKGSGGGASQSGSAVSAAGNGGGLLVLSLTGLLTNNGAISANGTDGSAGANGAGAGSGGSLNITAASMVGTGSFSVAGGIAAATLGQGAGGRIALTTTIGSIASSYTYTVRSGNGAGVGAASGTLYYKPAAQTYPDLIVDNGSVNSVKFTPLFISGEPVTVTVEDLSVVNLAKLLIDTPCSGTPALTVTGSTTLTNGGTITNNQSGTCTVSQGAIQIVTTTMPGAPLNSVYNQTIQSIGGYAPHSFDCRSGGLVIACSTVLPPGLDMSPSGVITGTATTLGLYPFTVRATEASPGSGFDEQALSIGVSNIPSAPTNLFSNNSDAQLGYTAPSGIDPSPVFSAVFNDPDLSDTASRYRVQVASDNGFSALLWDSGASGTAITSCANGSRCANINYAGSSLSMNGTTYYWRIKYWDNFVVEGDYSATGEFVTDIAPTAPTALFSSDSNAQSGLSNPVGILSGNPVFSAIFNDPDLSDTATQYRIQVDNDNNFSSIVWDSGSSGANMASCNQGDRCSDIVFGGTTLMRDETTYYWRIKYWDVAGVEGAWSQDPISTNSFTMATGGGSQQVLQQQELAPQPTVPEAPLAGAVEVLSATSVRFNWIDVSDNENGFRLLNADGNVVADVTSGVTQAIVSGLSANMLVSGYSVLAYNSLGQSPADQFEVVTTAAPIVRPVVQERGGDSVTFTIEPAFTPAAGETNAFPGQTAVQFEIVITSLDGSTRTVTSGFVQSNTYTFLGVTPEDSVQVRVVTRNQQGLQNEPTTYEDVSQLSRRFQVTLGVFQKDTDALPRPINARETVFVRMALTSVGTDPAHSVAINMPLPRYMVYRTGTLTVDGRAGTDVADQQGSVANQNGVSASWATVNPGETHTVSFELGFDIEALQQLRDGSSALAVQAAANPLVHLQASVSFAESEVVYFSPIVTLEPDVDSTVEEVPVEEPVEEPLPMEEIPVVLPTPEETAIIEQIFQQEFPQATPTPQPGEPTPAPSTAPTLQMGETVTSSDGGSFNIDVTGTNSTLGLTGSAEVSADSIRFTGTTTQPFTVITLIFNNSITAIVVSDAQGFWQTFVDADRLGIEPGQEARVTIEAVAAKGDLRSERVTVGDVTVSRGLRGNIEAEFDTTVSESAFVSAIEEIQHQVVRVVQEQEPVIKTTLTVSAPVVIVSSAPLWGYLPYVPTLIYHLITQLIGFIGRKKGVGARFYGVAYDSINKQPLALAIIRIYKQEPVLPQAASVGAAATVNKKLVTTVVTDKLGRYDALLEPGQYTLEVAKPGYLFPSQIVTTELDGDFQHVYSNASGIKVEGDQISIPDVPLDPINAQRQWQLAHGGKKVWMAIQRVGDHLAAPILIVGSIVSALVVITTPEKLSNWIIAIMYIILLALQVRFKQKVQKAWGVVYDIATNAILPLVTIQLIEPGTSKVVTSRLSDYEGRFTFLPEPGTYVLKASKPGFSQVTEVVQSPYANRQPLSQTITINTPSERVSGDVPMKQGV